MKNILLILSFIGFSAAANAQSLNLDAISKTKLDTIETLSIQEKGTIIDIITYYVNRIIPEDTDSGGLYRDKSEDQNDEQRSQGAFNSDRFNFW